MSRLVLFDSGLGGLSVLAEIRKALPRVSVTYCADAAAFPYGALDKATLIARVRRVVAAVVAREAPDAVVIACNTATTAALASLRADHPDLPFVGTVPAIKPAAALSRGKAIGLLATPATVGNPYIDDLMATYGQGCRLVRVAAAGLAPLAEAKLRGQDPAPAAIAAEIAPLFRDPDVDVVVLGCTHYPLLLPELVAAAPHPVTWIDSGAAIARRTAALMSESGPSGEDRVLVTALPEGYAEAFARVGLPAPILVEIAAAPTAA